VRHRGFILLGVLFALLVLTALSLAALALALAEVRGVAWDREWLISNFATGAAAVGAPGIELASGYRLERPDSGRGPARHRVTWCLDPDREAADGWNPDDPGAPRSPVSGLGPLGPSALLALVPPEFLLPFAALPASAPWLQGSAPVAVMPGGDTGAFLVVAEGDLLIQGPGTLVGAVVAGGTVRLEGPAVLLGGVRGSGWDPAEGGTFTPDPVAVAAALSALPNCPASVHLAGRLGRY
jgi:hypothetical protein